MIFTDSQLGRIMEKSSDALKIADLCTSNDSLFENIVVQTWNVVIKGLQRMNWWFVGGSVRLADDCGGLRSLVGKLGV